MKKIHTVVVIIGGLLLITLVTVFGLLTPSPARAAPPSHPLHAPGDCTVTTTADSGVGSFRQCILGLQPGATITFNTSIFPLASPTTISILSELPYIFTDSVTIDGTSAGVILDGSALSGLENGVRVDGADNVVIKGLQVLNFPNGGISINSQVGNDAMNNIIGGTNSTPDTGCSGDCNLVSGNGFAGIHINNALSTTITGNFIGTNLNGTAAHGNDDGIGLYLGAAFTLIGGNTPGERNLISGNIFDGITIVNSTTMTNTISGNYIGTDVSGTTGIGNANIGIYVGGGASANIIGGNNANPGGNCSGECNLVSGNGFDGILIENPGTVSNTVSGNYVGTDISGTLALGNGNDGIDLADGTTDNLIGGATTAERNLISGNFDDGISIGGSGTMSNTVSGNDVGTDVSGMAAIPNANIGVHVWDNAAFTIIGGNTPGERNLISGNGLLGVGIGTHDNKVQGNYIGTDVTGTGAIGNTDNGINLGGGAQNNLIGGINSTPGGACSGECNLISSNNEAGVAIEDSGTMSNTVSGNYIGTNLNGTAALGNSGSGVTLVGGTSNNTIGGTTVAKRNLISGHNNFGQFGVVMDATGTMSNTILGNFIGTDVNGISALPNDHGVDIRNGASQNVVSNNLISGNQNIGVTIRDSGSNDNKVQGNYIGTDITGTGAISNGGHGIFIRLGAQSNLIGGNNATPGGACSGECNLLSNNTHGVWIENTNTNSNTVSGNYVGTDVNGTAPLGNQAAGIVIQDASSYNVIGGDTPAERNLISANTFAGVGVVTSAAHNSVKGNYIGTDVSGTVDLGNNGSGLLFDSAAHDNLAENNLIAYSKYLIDIRTGPGILVANADTVNNTLRQNRVHSNVDKGILLQDGGNLELFPPILTDVDTNSVAGLAPPNSTVEIFSDNENEGQYFHGSMVADASGNFTFAQASAFTGTNVTATATDSDGNTSEFSVSYEPLVDVNVVAVLQPKSSGKTNQAITPTVKVGNGGTTTETGIDVTIQASGPALNSTYGPYTQTVDLPPLGIATLTFPPLAPDIVGSYDFMATVTLAGDQNATNDQKVISVTVSSDVIDLWTQDNETDNGDVPTSSFWQSPDVWVRNADDDETEHQDPIANQNNWVYMRVRNRGTTASDGFDTATVYWHQPSLAIKCGSWAPIDTTTIASTPANTSTQLLKFSWVPTQTGHTCLLGEITSDDDPIINPCDVPWDNNINQRNVNIIAGGAGIGSQASGGIVFEVTNIKDAPKPIDLIIDVSNVPDAEAVRLDLGADLAARWSSVNGFANSSGIDWTSGSLITITNATLGTIAGIPMNASETQTVTLLVNAPSVETTTVTVYEAIDAGSGVALVDAIVGGNTYVFNTPTSGTYLPIILK